MTGVDISVARAEERPVLANLMQLYVHDFSEYLVGRLEAELGEDGRFPDYPLDAYWQGGPNVPLLLRLDGRLVGFALLDRTSRTGRPVDRNMREFFIARRHRRAGVGTTAAQAIFSRYPGRWETAVARRNAPALPFWRQAVKRHPHAQDVEEFDLAPPDPWNGPVIRFRIAGTD